MRSLKAAAVTAVAACLLASPAPANKGKLHVIGPSIPTPPCDLVCTMKAANAFSAVIASTVPRNTTAAHVRTRSL